MAFADTSTKDEVSCSFTIPKDYVGASKAVVVWTANNATSNSVVWDFDYNAIAADGAESADPAAHTQQATGTSAHGGAAMDVNEISIALTAGNFAVDDVVLFQLGRDGVSGSDTLAADALVLAVLFEYANA